MDRLTTVWNGVHGSPTGITPGQPTSALAYCDPELKELMKQVDIMVHNKYMDWERETNILLAKVDLREKESVIQKATLEQKHREIGQLRKQIDGSDKAQREMVSRYEGQLSLLQSELANLKRDYTKVQKKQNKMSRDAGREQERKEAELQDSVAEMQRLNEKLEQYKQKCRKWEAQTSTCQKQLDSFEVQNKFLVEKCDLVQKQSAEYQRQLGRHSEALGSTDINLNSQIACLEGQVERFRDTVSHQDEKICSLKSQLEEASQGYRRMIDDNNILEDEVRKARNISKVLQDEVSELTAQLDSRDNLLCMATEDQHQHSEDLEKLEVSLREKEVSWRSAEEHRNRECEKLVIKLRSDMQTLTSQNKTYRKREKELNDNLSKIKSALEESCLECSNLTEELRTKTHEQEQIEKSEFRNMQMEMRKLQDRIGIMADRHNFEIEGMRRELTTLTTDLHQRNVTIASLSEKAANMEMQIRDESEGQERHAAELVVSNAQLEALRLENRHLRKVYLKQDGTRKDTNVLEVEGHLRELQNAYTMSLARLEEENKRLRETLRSQKEQLCNLEQINQDKETIVLQEAERALMELKDTGERRVHDMKTGYEQHLTTLQDRLESNSRRCAKDANILQAKNDALCHDFDSREKYIRRMTGRTVASGNSFEHVDQHMSSLIEPDQLSDTELMSSFPPSTGQMLVGSHCVGNERPSSRASISTKFYAEEQDKRNNLELLVESTIQELNKQTGDMMQEYS